MRQKIIKAVAGAAVFAVAGAGAMPAVAAKHGRAHRSHAVRHASNTASGTSSTGSGETALTGSALSSASSAATTANPGATVNSATTENDSSDSSAAYEVHITKSDGTRAVVLERSDFSVITTQSGGTCAHG
jgi:hypothetical protein